MTEKRFTRKSYSIWDNLKNEEFYELHYRYEVDDMCDKLNKVYEENEQLKQYKQSVSDVLLSWSQKNLNAKQLQVVIAIMGELNILGDVE